MFGKLASAADKAMDSISKRAGTSKFDGSTTVAFKPESIMGKQMEDYNSRIKRMTTQMSAVEDRYYKQFAAMEAAMTKYQSQLSQLTGSVG
ncbi:flagellar filament capping protein FliD [Paenibacillus amylolyticus]|nr:flagellar filament capping protein FliD [Paenibacillus amylolyticus]